MNTNETCGFDQNTTVIHQRNTSPSAVEIGVLSAKWWIPSMKLGILPVITVYQTCPTWNLASSTKSPHVNIFMWVSLKLKTLDYGRIISVNLPRQSCDIHIEIHMGAILNILLMMMMMMMLLLLLVVVVVVEATQMVMTDDIQYEIGIDLLPRKSDLFHGWWSYRTKQKRYNHIICVRLFCILLGRSSLKYNWKSQSWDRSSA